MMVRRKDYNGRYTHAGQQDVPRSTARQQPILAAKRRRQLHPFFFRVGPVALSICSVLLVGLTAILYLSQLGQAVTANQEIQHFHGQQALLQRENQDMLYQVAQEQAPAYIAEHAKSLGLVPADPKTVKVLVVRHLQLFQNGGFRNILP